MIAPPRPRALIAVLIGCALCLSGFTPSAAPAAGVAVVVVATPRGSAAQVSEVRIETIDPRGVRERTLGTIAHVPGAVIRGDVLVDGSIVVAADDGRGDYD